MEKKYLSDCIRYTTDIAPYPFIQIYSGVGSGKNTFVDALAKGYEESQPDGRMETLEPKRVLCITSRRAKVDELKNAEDVAYGTQVLEYLRGGADRCGPVPGCALRLSSGGK